MINHLASIAGREWRVGFRNPWSYSFMGLFSLFMLILLLLNHQGYVGGYSAITGTMLQLILYLLPLMTLTLGAFSLTGEKEDGSWELLSTYPLSSTAFLLGKYIGLAVLLLVILAFSFGLAGIASELAGISLTYETFIQLFLFSLTLVLMFLAISFVIGTCAHNRWQALTIAVTIWFLFIVLWPSLLIAVLGLLPYAWIKPAMSALTIFNPAELARLYAIIKLGGGAVLGPEYYDWVSWIDRPSGTLVFFIFTALWILVTTGIANWLWERGRKRG